MKFKYLLVFFIIYFSISCSNVDDNKLNKTQNISKPDEIYISANNYFKNKQYIEATEEFKKLNKLYPLSNEAIQAQIMIGFIHYIKMEYADATLQFDRIINKYPSHKNLDYVYYMRAMCNYEQIAHEGLDGEFNNLALEDFNQVINRFPLSTYSKDSRQKIILVKSNQAAKHMNIGRFYLKEKKYTAALSRFKIVIEDYSMTKFTPEALHRTVEVYFNLDMKQDANKTAAVLGHNYPNSKWYKYSYDLIKNIDDKKSFLGKVKNIF